MQSNEGNMLSNDGDLTSETDKSIAPERRRKRHIDQLFGSGARVDLLWAYLNNPDEWMGPRELERLTGRSLSDVQRNNGILASIGLIEMKTIGGVCAPRWTDDGRLDMDAEDEYARRELRRPFSLNKDHPWVGPLRMLLERSIGSLNVLQEALEALPEIDVAFIFGSFATGEQRPGSDVDLMVIGQQTLMSIAEPISEVENKIGRSIDVITMQPQEWRQRWEEKNHFVQSLMYDPKVFLTGDDERLEQITTGPRSKARESI